MGVLCLVALQVEAGAFAPAVDINTKRIKPQYKESGRLCLLNHVTVHYFERK